MKLYFAVRQYKSLRTRVPFSTLLKIFLNFVQQKGKKIKNNLNSSICLSCFFDSNFSTNFQ